MLSMNAALRQNFDRIVAARERLLEVRSGRVGTILRLQSYLRARLDDFFTNLDPVSGSRFADLGAEGSKGAGEMALILAMFDGSRMRIGVDGSGRFNHESNPNVFEDVEEILNFDISADFTTASIDFVPVGSPTGRAVRAPFDAFVDRLVQHTLESIEGAVAPGSGAAAPVAPVAAVPPAPVLQAVPEYDVPRIARPSPPELHPVHLEAAPAYRVEEPAAPAYRIEESTAPVYRSEELPAGESYRTELPRLDAERELDPVRYTGHVPEPVRYSEKVRPLERPRPVESEHDMERITHSSAVPVSGIPLKPRGLSFSVR
jgi:hypothetical protein